LTKHFLKVINPSETEADIFLEKTQLCFFKSLVRNAIVPNLDNAL